MELRENWMISAYNNPLADMDFKNQALSIIKAAKPT